jgi:hypothetical protein
MAESRYDRVESCALVEHIDTDDLRLHPCDIPPPVDGNHIFDIALAPLTSFALRIRHQPMPAGLQRRELQLGRAVFLPNDAATETHELVLRHVGGAPARGAPQSAIDAVRALTRNPMSKRQETYPPEVRLYPCEGDRVEVRLTRALPTEDVVTFVKEGPTELQSGQWIDLAALEDDGWHRVLTIPAGQRLGRFQPGGGSFTVIPVAVPAGRRQVLMGNVTHWRPTPPVRNLQHEFIANGDLLLRWDWQGNVRARLIVTPRPDVTVRHHDRRFEDHMTRTGYAARNYAHVPREAVDALLEGMTEASPTAVGALLMEIQVLDPDDWGGTGPGLSIAKAVVRVPRWRLRP